MAVWCALITSESRIEAEQLAARISGLPYVADTVCLPDLHMKEAMEAPSSFVVATRGVIVPHLVSEAINWEEESVPPGIDE